MDNREEFLNLTQYDMHTNQFRKMYKNCNTCLSIENIDYIHRKLGILERISEYLITLRLSRL